MVDLAGSLVMPRVETTSGRLSVPADVVDMIEAAARRYGLSRDETTELVLRASLTPVDQGAVELREVLEDGRTHSQADVSVELKRAEADLPVAAVRLGSYRSTTDTAPFVRDHIGANLTDDPLTVWPAARGLWKVSDRASILVAYRIGWPLAIYRIGGWNQDTHTGRRWARDGIVISGAERQDAETGELRGDITAADKAITAVVMGRALVLPPGAANPVVWLNSH